MLPCSVARCLRLAIGARLSSKSRDAEPGACAGTRGGRRTPGDPRHRDRGFHPGVVGPFAARGGARQHAREHRLRRDPLSGRERRVHPRLWLVEVCRPRASGDRVQRRALRLRRRERLHFTRYDLLHVRGPKRQRTLHIPQFVRRRRVRHGGVQFRRRSRSVPQGAIVQRRCLSPDITASRHLRGWREVPGGSSGLPLGQPRGELCHQHRIQSLEGAIPKGGVGEATLRLRLHEAERLRRRAHLLPQRGDRELE
jgi:hypothetical protein